MRATQSDDVINDPVDIKVDVKDIKKKEIKYDISHLQKQDFGKEPGAFSETETEALRYHAEPVAGKYTIQATKIMDTEKDLTLAYSPGVAEPCLKIQ